MTTPERLRTASVKQAMEDTGEEPVLGNFGCYVAGEWLKTGDAIEVRSPYDDSLVAIVHRAGPEEIETAIARAAEAFQTTRKLPA
jgi:delta 1-pyrroline-5-carboxylate dehydrogenase